MMPEVRVSLPYTTGKKKGYIFEEKVRVSLPYTTGEKGKNFLNKSESVLAIHHREEEGLTF